MYLGDHVCRSNYHLEHLYIHLCYSTHSRSLYPENFEPIMTVLGGGKEMNRKGGRKRKETGRVGRKGRDREDGKKKVEGRQERER